MSGYKIPICRKCGSSITYLGQVLNTHGKFRYVSQFRCCNGHNNQYAYKRGAPYPEYIVEGIKVNTKEEAIILCNQFLKGCNYLRRPKVRN